MRATPFGKEETMLGKTPRMKRARLALAIAAMVCATGVQAQETEAPPPATPAGDGQAKTLDAVSVTGTRIKSKTMTAASPVMEIDAESFRQTGSTRVEDLVNQYPQLASNFDSFDNNGSDGYGTVSLRDLGPQRTLTLLNGRRLPNGSGETTDVTIIPAALLKRVDILSGGASAVYGSDAVAGVVNFVLDDEFEGVSANVGYSGYQHDNDNRYMRGLIRDADYDYPSGNSGLDGIARNLDLAIGGKFGESGHAVGWLTWRKNEALGQDRRDYSACALSSKGTACGGSATSDPPNFLVYDGQGKGGFAYLGGDGRWASGQDGLYNFAPSNYYQRPDERFTGGMMLRYEITPQFRPYVEAEFVHHKSTVQIAPSGTFFADDIEIACNNSLIGTLCNDLSVATPNALVTVGKRNVEGGPRITDTTTNGFRFVVGANGDLNENWSYDASFLYARGDTTERGRNDFLKDRISDAILGCQPGSFRGCLPYNVWVPNGVTPAAAAALAGTSLSDYSTDLMVLSWYVNGDTGKALPWADDETFKVAGGMEWRSESYSRHSDNDTRTGNFAGAGGPNPDVSGDYNVAEVFLEGALPIVVGAGPLDRFGAEFGYRYSDYSTSGGVNTYKVGLTADMFENRVHLRGGYNRAIRAPSVTELYSVNSISLWSGTDPCAGNSPEFSPAECARTGVSDAQYGRIPASPSDQNNQYGGGNRDLQPEEADTWTVGAAFSPIRNLDVSVDYYDISITDAITTIGASQILRTCAQSGEAALCDRVHRSSSRGDIWIGDDLQRSGYVFNRFDNFGNFHYRGIDLTARYLWTIGPGSLVANIVGSYVVEQENEPIPGFDDATYDCAGNISESCMAPEWRHVANLRYSWDDYSVGLRWRYIGKVDYEDTDGSPGAADRLVASRGGIDAANYFDLSGSLRFAEYWEWTLGVNNVFDREPPLVGAALSNNGNSPGGYDQAGRYLFTSLSYRY